MTVARLSAQPPGNCVHVASNTPTEIVNVPTSSATAGVQVTLHEVVLPPPGSATVWSEVAQFRSTRSRWPPPRRRIWMNPLVLAPSLRTDAVTVVACPRRTLDGEAFAARFHCDAVAGPATTASDTSASMAIRLFGHAPRLSRRFHIASSLSERRGFADPRLAAPGLEVGPGRGEAGEGTALICPLALVLLGFCCCGYAAAVQSSDQCDPIWKCLRNFQRRLANQVSFTVGCLGSDGNLCVFAIAV